MESKMSDLLKVVKNYIEKNNLINNKKVILAFSYGVDSRVLLDVLYKLGYEIVIAHVNHKVRVESDNEELETIKLCKSLNLKYYIKHLTPQNENFEDYARRERYNFFKEISIKENTNVLITAHHKDDNLETILLKLMTGSNLYGYSGIHNKLFKNGLLIIRPLLCVSKEEIRTYQKENNLLFFEDYTNSLNIQLRNKIRNEVIPLLKEINPSILDKASDFSNILAESFDYIRSNSISLLNEWNDKIDNIKYKQLDIALRKDIICLMLEKNKINRSYSLINSIDNLIMSNKPQGEISISDNFVFKKRYDVSLISIRSNKTILDISLNINDCVVFFNHKIYFTKDKPLTCQNYVKLCYNKVKLPLRIRTRLNGDSIQLSGGTKKVKDLFIDKKIKKELRDEIPMVINGNDIIWIPGVAKSSLIKDDLESGDIYLIYEEK
jgi:tRNA(Ile)-lysidine synthetase-like protein